MQEALKNRLSTDGVIPDIIDNAFETDAFLNVSYKPDIEAGSFGTEFQPKDAQSAPKISVESIDASQYYTLVMADPDAPSFHDRKFGPWRHWVVTNIAGSNVQDDILNVDNQHTPYIGPGPGPNTGTHRYVFLLYKQNNGKQEYKPMKHQEREDRRKFDIRTFEKDNQLTLVAINYFLCPT